MNICRNCFTPLQSPGKCPSCGFDPSSERRYEGVISPGVRIKNGRYTVGRVLGRGGFGIIYKAKDNETGGIVTVKEYMPSEYSMRLFGTFAVIPYDNEKSRRIFQLGKERFADGAKKLIRLRNNPISVDVLDYFEESNTAYLVFQPLAGSELRTIAKKSGGKIDSKSADECFVTLAKGLAKIHGLNIFHGGISPDNIIVSDDKKKITLLNFEESISFIDSEKRNLPIPLITVYSPPELFISKGHWGPWSDVYALCAAYYNIVSGKTPTDALMRLRGQYMPTLEEMGCNIPAGMSAVIDKGMSLDVKDRYKNFTQLLEDTAKIKALNRKQDFGRSANTPYGGFKQRIPYITFISSGVSSNIGFRDIFKIGRKGQGCNMSLSDSRISRIHCCLTFDGNNFRLTDVSSNGTFLENGERLVKEREYILPPGSKFYTAERENMFIVNCR